MFASWQPSLLDAGEPAIDRSFATLIRRRLDERSWVDLVPRWVTGADDLFDAIVQRAGWQQRNRWMYDKRVDEPRLTASWRATGEGQEHGAIHPLIDEM